MMKVLITILFVLSPFASAAEKVPNLLETKVSFRRDKVSEVLAFLFLREH